MENNFLGILPVQDAGLVVTIDGQPVFIDDGNQLYWDGEGFFIIGF